MVNERLIVTYSAQGQPYYPEDTWDCECEIKNKSDMYKFIIYIHKRDSRSFNDYPLGGWCSNGGFKFEIEKSTKIDGEVFICPQRITVNKPEFFDDAYKQYKELCNRMKTTLPNLRLANENKIQQQNELSQYELLKHKFKNK